MGLPMRDIHAPGVQSGQTSSPADPFGKDDKRSLQELIAEKDGVESELRALGAVLDSHGVNMNTSLTSFDGFPRSDVDVAQIRTTRARIIHLRNDYKALMAKIETGLHAHYAATAASDSQTSSTPAGNTSSSAGPSTGASSSDIPFAKVNSVVANSPAEGAGLMAGDLIQKFGDANWLNHEKLSKVAQIVGQNEGVRIPR